MLGVVMLGVVMLGVVMLSVVAPPVASCDVKRLIDGQEESFWPHKKSIRKERRKGCHDIRHFDIQHNDIRHNET
jgi:hypothetical protein